MYGHYNVRQYVLWRDGYTCQCCGARPTKKMENRETSIMLVSLSVFTKRRNLECLIYLQRRKPL